MRKGRPELTLRGQICFNYIARGKCQLQTLLSPKQT
jgi:hypothetical protein